MTEEKVTDIELIGKIIIDGIIRNITGLHIGKGKSGLQIGEEDLAVIRDPIDQFPYIPGSSLKGKMRCLIEKSNGLPLSGMKNRIHSCDNPNCDVCTVYGRPGDSNAATPTRIIVRDAHMTASSKERLEKMETELLYTELKSENVIDRITSEANPRQIERVPRNCCFDFSIVFNIFEENDWSRMKYVIEGLKLVQDDYLGGHGSRGYGQVKFTNLTAKWRPVNYYKTGEGEKSIEKSKNIKEFSENLFQQMESWKNK